MAIVFHLLFLSVSRLFPILFLSFFLVNPISFMDDVEQGLFHPVGGGPGVHPLELFQSSAPCGAGDHSHGHSSFLSA